MSRKLLLASIGETIVIGEQHRFLSYKILDMFDPAK